jgi:hypothetical protein
VVEYQRTHIPAEWLLQLGGMAGGWPGMGSDLGIALVLVHRRVSRGDRCESDRCRGGGHGQWCDNPQSHLFSPQPGATSLSPWLIELPVRPSKSSTLAPIYACGHHHCGPTRQLQLIRRGDHRSVYALEADIRAWVKNWNADPKPFVWTKTAQDILESLGRLIN